MAEKVLKIKTLSEVSEAISGLTDLQGSLKGVGTAAFEAAGKSKAEWKALEAEMSKTTGTAKGMADQAFKVESALNAMGRAGSQSQLESGLVRAKIELNSFKAKIDEVRAAGGTIDDGMVNSLQTMEAAVEAGKNKLNGLREATETAKKQLGLMAGPADTAAKSLGGVKDQSVGVAKGVMAASGAVGPFGEVLEKLSASGTGAASSMASLGFKVVAAGAAFKVGYDAGTSFNKFLQEHGNLLEKVIDLQIRNVQGLGDTKELLSALPTAMNTAIKAKQQFAQEVTATLDALQKESGGWKDLDKVREEAMAKATLVSQRYNQLRAEGKEWRGEMELQAGSIAATTEILQKLGVQFKDMPMGFETASKHVAEFEMRLEAAARVANLTGAGVRGLRDTLEALPDNLENFKLQEVMDGLSKAIASAAKEGKDWSVILSDYAPELDKLREAARDAGVEGLALFRETILDLLPAHEAAIVAVGSQADATEAALARMNAAADVALQQKLDRWAKEDARGPGGNFSAPVAKGLEEVRQNAIGAAVAAGQFGTSLDVVAAKVVSLGGTLSVGTPVLLNVTEATNEQTAALYRQAAAYRDLTAAQTESLDAARGWSDYIIALKDGYESGVTSLGSYIQQLVAFKSQLLSMFSGLTGEAKSSLEEMIRLIETLVQTAGAGGPVSRGGGYAGQFQRDMDKKKKGK